MRKQKSITRVMVHTGLRRFNLRRATTLLKQKARTMPQNTHALRRASSQVSKEDNPKL